ncbi:MAG TPA: hypothetical protein VGC90_02860 [Candidatus Limnocylindrales bacterium]
MRSTIASRLAGRRIRYARALVALGAVALVAGTFLPWLRGLTKFHGIVDWNGVSEEGDGLILVVLAILLFVYARWRTTIEEMDERGRWVPCALAVVAGLIWLIAIRKATGLVYEGPNGAQVQVGLFVVALGVVLAFAGGWLIARDPSQRRVSPLPPRRVGGRDRATGAEYSVTEKVEPGRPIVRD